MLDYSYSYLYFVNVIGLPYINARDTECTEILPNLGRQIMVLQKQHRPPSGPFLVEDCFPHSLQEM